MITITLTREEMLRASDEMTPAEKQATYLMSQSPLISTQLCSLFEMASALEKADAKTEYFVWARNQSEAKARLAGLRKEQATSQGLSRG